MPRKKSGWIANRCPRFGPSGRARSRSCHYALKTMSGLQRLGVNFLAYHAIFPRPIRRNCVTSQLGSPLKEKTFLLVPAKIRLYFLARESLVASDGLDRW